MELKDCFKEDFTTWLVKSNHPKMRQLDNEEKIGLKLHLVREESLQEILEFLLREPLADYFWYSYTGKLTYALPHHEVVASGSIRVDSDKIKMFLRNYKIGELLK